MPSMLKSQAIASSNYLYSVHTLFYFFVKRGRTNSKILNLFYIRSNMLMRDRICVRCDVQYVLPY